MDIPKLIVESACVKTVVVKRACNVGALMVVNDEGY